MTDFFIQKLISLIERNTSPAMLPVAFLMDALSIGKEAAYRRLRGDVPITFSEMVKISQRLEVSLDDIANASLLMNNSKWATINLDTLYLFSTNYSEQYYENIAKFKSIFKEMTKSSSATLRYAGASIPFSMMLDHKNLALFMHYKRMYLSQEVNRDFTFNKMTPPQVWLDFDKQFVEFSRKIPRTLLILDRNMFASLINDINYFFNEDLITKDERLKLKTELLDLIDYAEKLAKEGVYETENEVNIYLADVTINSSYAHIELDETAYAINILYFIDILVYQNAKFCQKQKNWIELLKKFSTLITKTGERQRFEFFNKQRELVKTLLSDEA